MQIDNNSLGKVFLLGSILMVLTSFLPDLDDNSCPTINYNLNDNNNNNTLSCQKQKKFLQLLSNSSAMYGSHSKNSSFYNGSSQSNNYCGSNSSSSCDSSLADLDDITIVKEEPLSPHSSCPPSPNSNYGNTLPSISSINPDLIYERKVGKCHEIAVNFFEEKTH